VILGLACLLLVAAGCALGSRQPQGGPAVTLTEKAAPSALVAVISGTQDGPALARLVAATARTEEHVDVIRAGPAVKVLVAASSPAPATDIVPGRPEAPGAGATSYQQAAYGKRLGSWRDEVSAGRRDVVARTRAALSAWATGLRIEGQVSRPSGGNEGAESLASECDAAASVLAGLTETGDSFGGRRVVLLYAQSLSGGTPAAGELNGDDVIVVTPFLPSAAAISWAQASLLGSGAAQASVLGPESTAAEVAQLVSAGLSQHVGSSETLSGPALFANNSAVLLPAAVSVLTPLLLPLRKPGAIAVINGYASTPGSAAANYRLSYARAAAVAGFFVARGIPASSLVIVGHGATGLVAPGPSAANRRVTVVIEDSTSEVQPSG